MMTKLEMKNYNMILTDKQQKYQHYHLEKLITINILQVQKYYNAIYNHIKNSRINLHKEEKNPKEFRSKLSEILKRNQNCESKNQISTMKKYKTALQCLEKRS